MAYQPITPERVIPRYPSTSTLSWSDLQLSEDSSSGQKGPSSKLEDPVKRAAFDPQPATWCLPPEEFSIGQEGPSSKVEDSVKGADFDPQPATGRLPREGSPSGQEAPAKKAKKESKLR